MAPLKPEDVLSDTRRISTIRVVVHTENGQPHWSDNHWSMYLLFKDSKGNEGSVRGNMTLENPLYTRGKLEWSQHDYITSNSCIKSWDLRTKEGIEVRHLARLMYGKHLDEYLMCGGGSGCRYWM